jgi:hypothetical protein
MNTFTAPLQYKDSGFASTQFLFILTFITILVLGIGVYGYSAVRWEVHSRRKIMTFSEMGEILQKIIADMYADPSPDINSPEDPLGAWNGRTEGSYTIAVSPLSDGLNLNFVRKNVFEKTNIGLFLKSGRTAGDLQQFREDKGLSLSLEAYDSFFPAEILEKYFSCYGWANINLIDEFSARKLTFSLTGSEYTAEEVRQMIQTLLINQQPAQPSDLRSLFGIYYEDLFPFINTEALINVNYAEPALLRELIAYPDYAVVLPDVRCDELLTRRSLGGLGPHDILGILGIDVDNPLASYLGGVTWFWEIVITGNGQTSRTVICRVPQERDQFDQSSQFDQEGRSAEIVYNIIDQRLQ